jgi:PAS domain S-box-containing protein
LSTYSSNGNSTQLTIDLPPSPFSSIDSLFSESGLAHLIQSPMLAWDTHGFALGWNEAAEGLFGWSSDEVLGKNLLEVIVPPDARPAIVEDVVGPLAGGLPVQMVNENLTKDGRTILCEWHNAPIKDETGRVVGAVSLARDITLDRHAERERERLYEIATAANAARNLDEILLLIRSAVIEVGGFDRCGIWLMEGGKLQGAWGTDDDGRLRDEHCYVCGMDDFSPALAQMLQTESPYAIDRRPFVQVLPLGELPDSPDQIFSAMRLDARGELLGVIFADNKLTSRTIDGQHVEALLPFVEHTAVAITNARLLAERERTLDQQRRLMEISAAINGSLELDEVLRLVRDAAIEVGGFDRAGVFRVKDEMVYGAWGTDREGQVRDEHHLQVSLADWHPFNDGHHQEYRPFSVIVGPCEVRPGDPPAVERPYAQVQMRVGGDLVGLLFVDNIISGRPVTAQNVSALLSFTEQAAIAIRNAALMEEREKHLERQKRLARLAAAIGSRTALNDILRMLRDAVVEAGGFDRAGVHLYNARTGNIYGTWGTDREGHPLDESSSIIPWEDSVDMPFERVASGELKYKLITDYTAGRGIDPSHPLYGVHAHGTIPLRAGEEVVGVLFVDNLLRKASITDADIQVLLPFADQAAVAIQNAALMEERARHLARQKRLTQLATAISMHTDLTDILRMVRDAVVEATDFDRAGIFLYDPETKVAYGAWGTDRAGNAEDISGERYTSGDICTQWPMWRVLGGDSAYAISHNLQDEFAIPEGDAMENVRGHAAVALRAGSEVVGALCVDNLFRGAPIAEEDIESLLPFAEQAAVAVQNARLFGQLKLAQEALIRSEKMRALGELASGVAHNINNLLTAVLGYAELIQQTEDLSPQVAHFARIIERAGLDGAEIVRRVQQFARSESKTAFQMFDLAAVLREAIDLTRPAWLTQPTGKGIQIEIVSEMAPELPAIGVPSEIREVIVNLVRNAADAMPQGGTLILRAYSEDGQSVVQVTDTGVGMDEATRSRVFEPFFTTKGTALGTGLGLSIAWGIIARHNGRIEVVSAPGEGSTFIIRLPQPEAAELAEPSTNRPGNMPLAGMRLLLVEDEEFVSQGVARMLTARGASLYAAENATEALAWLSAHPAECDAVISDHGMAGMTGLELLAVLREQYPHIRRILLSGWGTHPPGDADVSSAELILSKPIRIEELSSAVEGLAKEGPIPAAAQTAYVG